MTIEILSIGNELLSGHTVNKNAAVIGQNLLAHGFSVDKVTVLPDEKTTLKKGIEEALKRSLFVIATGGLGPTGDDLTREVVSTIFETPLVYDEAVAEDLANRFGKELPSLKDQAMVLKGSTVIPNALGTAPGFILEGKGTLFVLPGVPLQMEAMLPEVIAYLEKNHTRSHYVASLYLSLLSEGKVDPYLRTLERENPDVTMGICPGYGTLSVYVHGKDQNKITALRDQVAQTFKSYVFSTTSKQIEKALQEWMVKNQKSLVVAESCTGGEIGARLTKHPGSSAYFLGSIVAYSNHLKETVLGVSKKTLQTYGAVSQEVVIEMARGAQNLSGADYAIATSGIAGPDGETQGKPVGTVWSAIVTPTQTFSGLIPIKTRERRLVIEYAATYLLASLYRYLNNSITPYDI